MRKTSLVLAVLVIFGVIYGVVQMGRAGNIPSPQSPPPEREGVKSKTEILVKDGKVSMDLVEADLVEVLKKFGQTAGIEITVGEGVSGKVNMKFSDLPLREGLEKIIGQSDYALEYTGAGLSKVRLTNKKGEAGKQTGAAAKQAEGCKIEYNKDAKTLKFLDCKGKVIKQVDTSCSIPYISPNNKYVAMPIVIADTPEAAAIEVKHINQCFGKARAGGHYEVVLMDNAGNVIWSKKMADNRAAEKVIMSDNAEAVVFLTGELDYFRNQQLNVLNNVGEEILKVPEDSELGKKRVNRPLSYKLSANGKYLGIEFIHDTTGFYDLEKGTSWELPEMWGIHSISNDGQAKLFFQAKSKEVDIKNYLETK